MFYCNQGSDMEKIPAGRLRDVYFEGKAILMVHLKDDKAYWERMVPQGVEVRTSHSLGFRAIRRAYRINATSVNQLKIAYLLDRLIPDEPDTETQRERLMRLIKAAFEHLATKDALVGPEEKSPVAKLSPSEDGPPGYRDVVITLATLAKKEACQPQETQVIDAVLARFSPYYHVFRTRLAQLNREQVINYVAQALELSLPKNGVLDEYDFADQIWLPAISEDVPLEWIDTLLIEENPGFYEAEKRMVERWRRGGTQVVEVIREPLRFLTRDKTTPDAVV